MVVALALVGPQVLRVESAWGDNPPPATQPSTAISDLLTTTDGYLKANPIAADSLAAMGSGVNALLASEIASGAVEWGGLEHTGPSACAAPFGGGQDRLG